MATTSIWKVEKRLDVVVDYVVNEKKTSEANYYELHKVEEYAKASYKTEEQLYVIAINCDKDRIVEEMIETKKIFQKEDGIIRLSCFSIICRGRSNTRTSTQNWSRTCTRIMGR